jgi:hypothetical protein
MASFLLAINAYHIRYSQEARSYALMAFLALLCLTFLLLALRNYKKRFWLGFILCSSLSLYNHYFAFLFLPALVIYAAVVIAQDWSSQRSDNDRVPGGRLSRAFSPAAKQALMLSLSIAVVGLSYVPWLPALQMHSALFTGSQEGALFTTGGIESSARLLHTLLTDFSGLTGAALLLWMGVFIVGLAASDLRQIALVSSALATPFLFLAVGMSGYPSKPRYVLFLLPVTLLVIARGILSGARSVASHLPFVVGDGGRALPVMPALLVLILASVGVPALKEYYLWQKEDWRNTAAYLQQNMLEEDVVIADGEAYGRGGDAYRTVQGLTHYNSLPYEAVTILQAQRGLLDGVQEMPDTEASAWGVLWHASPLANLDRVSPNIKIVEFPWVTVVELLDPTGDLLRDTVSVLQALLVLQPHPEGRFDLHLALAQLYLRTGLLEGANSQLRMAGLAEPDDPRALAALEEARLEFDRVSRVMEEVQHPLGLNLGGVVALLGYDVRPTVTKPGESLSVTLWWQTVRNMARDYSVFIHVIDQYGAICAQQDTLLRRGDLNTSTWKPGDMVREEYELRLGPDALPGKYSVKAGIYYWQTGERLPVWDEDGERLLGDAISLGSIEVTE